jgi:hypothetical protein
MRQRKEERAERCLNKGDIEEVLRGEYLPEAVGSSGFDTAIRMPVDTAPGEMDGEALGGGNRVPIAPEIGWGGTSGSSVSDPLINLKDIDYNKDEKVKCLKQQMGC